MKHKVSQMVGAVFGTIQKDQWFGVIQSNKNENKWGRYALKCISAPFRWCLLKYILYVEGIGVGDAFA